MKFVCLLHESELQVTELTEYKGTDTSVRHIVTINYSHTYLHQIQSMQKCDKSILTINLSLISFTIITLKY